MLQQKLHRERLEQLVQKKNEVPINPKPQLSVETNQNQQQTKVNKIIPNISPNISINSTTSKLKQENSFDIFELISNDCNLTTTTTTTTSNVIEYRNQNFKVDSKKKQQNFSLATTLHSGVDEDENKLFEEIFFVN